MSTGWHRDRGGRVRVWAVSVLKSDLWLRAPYKTLREQTSNVCVL